MSYDPARQKQIDEEVNEIVHGAVCAFADDWNDPTEREKIERELVAADVEAMRITEWLRETEGSARPIRYR